MASFVSEFAGQALVRNKAIVSKGTKQVTKALFSRKPAAPKTGTATKKASPVKRSAPVKKAAPTPAKKSSPIKRAAPKKVAPKKVAAPKRGASAPAPKSDASYNLDKWYGPDRKLFLPGGTLPRETVPAWLTGELAGDYGYDPLSIGATEEGVKRLRGYELLHARWAMLSIPGMLLPEYQSYASGNSVVAPVWFETGGAMLDGGLLTWYGIPIPLPLIGALVVEFLIFGAIEDYRKRCDGPLGSGLDPLYPGGLYFDPLGLADDPDAFAELKVKEIKNGRLAMMATLGFGAQAYVTKEGPYANWAQHVADPFGYNLFTVIGNAERVPTL
mmetsp:Transcript_21714/g.30194  ORF Transcript_21714/g.30194 Transcript_21714/m.30194 type:complete len:329 (+) Transcript_21714:102-1088(+)|eukprot:CAMPEP_0196571046 /NCGR_PEP_ID=MMETSP1081-20130531/1210_1 /TAXON_ID=36882 /ORGANISM="Pyramimonas amylifera, Strain CCMP720" /LENGTH=328 /DNA_ID=CAMNT_0041887805 /DNA_START=102 /DNA_END=1088 /DNA_ORIENTATION=-